MFCSNMNDFHLRISTIQFWVATLFFLHFFFNFTCIETCWNVNIPEDGAWQPKWWDQIRSCTQKSTPNGMLAGVESPPQGPLIWHIKHYLASKYNEVLFSLSAAIISALIKLETIYPCFEMYIFVKIKRAFESFVLNLCNKPHKGRVKHCL